MTNQDQYGLPELPPIEDVVKHIRPGAQGIDADSRTECDSLRKELQDLRKKYEDLAKKVETDKTPQTRTFNCPILEGKDGNGRIEVLGINTVVCKHFYRWEATWTGEKEYRCDITNRPCNYAK